MHVDLTSDGEPISAFLRACAARRIDLSGADGGPHPLQVIPAQWRQLGRSLAEFSVELARVKQSFEPDGEELVRRFRQTVYDAVELFDGYAALVPSRLVARDKPGKRRLREYQDTAKRLRDFAGKVCNRCKHHGAQLKFLWATSSRTGQTSARLLVSTYAEGDALLRDDTVHGGQMAGMGLVRLAQQLGHNLLRIDRAAGRLIDEWPEGDVPALADVNPALPVGHALRTLASLRATRHTDEPESHDGLTFYEGRIGLIKVKADDLGLDVGMRAAITMEAGTTRYSFA